jgi:metallophosphoesterase (TIGR00282 family)
MSKILFIGDVIGKPGRKVLREVLPQWKEKYQPDVVIVNVENIAHGKGVTLNTINGINDLGIDAYTSGNHVFDKDQLSAECFENFPNLIRPANFVGNFPGHGYYRFVKNDQHYLVLNFNATVFMENQFDGEIANPFFAVDQMLLDQAQKGDIIIVDFHSEATSEKVAFGWYLDGRVTGLFGTHTHVPTADYRVLPKGTAYISDAGMTGPLNSVIGVVPENSLTRFLEKGNFKMELQEEGPLIINGVLIEAGEDGKAISIERVSKEISN